MAQVATSRGRDKNRLVAEIHYHLLSIVEQSPGWVKAAEIPRKSYFLAGGDADRSVAAKGLPGRRTRVREEAPVTNRPTMRQLSEARNVKRREEMQVAIAEGLITVRQMTVQERRQADHDRARVVSARALRAARRSH